jgi:tetratricopeptide (TPR) repeat protein
MPGGVYHAMQLWEEARSTLEEAVVLSETLGLGHFRVSALSQLCMHYALAGQWEAAYRYAVKAIILRKSTEAALIAWDFFQQYETEALLRGGEERQAREAVQRLGEGLGPNHRFRLPYLRSLAVLAAWEGNTEQAIDHLREAAGLAAEFGLPAEQWQIQERLGRLYQASGEQEQARTAFGEATRIILGLAGGIGDEALRTNFLAGPQIQPLLQQGQREASPVPNDHAEPNHQRPHDLESEKDVL